MKSSVDQLASSLNPAGSYDEYVRLDQVLDAPRPLTPAAQAEVRAAERFFIVSHQASELWLSQMYEDLRLAADLVGRRDLDQALPTIGRARAILDLIITTLNEMVHLSVTHFDAFRPSLVGASGAQSQQFALLLQGLDNPYVFQLSRRLQECHPREVGRDRLVRAWDALDEIVVSIEVWRRTHIKLARHFVGHRPGTGGTSGVAYLESRANALAAP